MKKSKIRKILIGIALTILALVVVLAVAFKIYSGNFYRADESITDEFLNRAFGNVASYQNRDGKVFIPRNQDYKAVIVFYPGGKVEYTAYSGLMYELANRGFICLLPRMPENLAFLRVNAVDVMTKRYSKEKESVEYLDWYLAGHSLGGVAASTFLAETNNEYAGLILCASYTTNDFSDSDYRLLSIYGSEDKVLNMDSYRQSKDLWPVDSEEYVIQGGIHSYFGNYGIQDGDGVPTISNEQQIMEAADVISSFCSD